MLEVKEFHHSCLSFLIPSFELSRFCSSATTNKNHPLLTPSPGTRGPPLPVCHHPALPLRSGDLSNRCHQIPDCRRLFYTHNSPYYTQRRLGLDRSPDPAPTAVQRFLNNSRELYKERHCAPAILDSTTLNQFLGAYFELSRQLQGRPPKAAPSCRTGASFRGAWLEVRRPSAD